MINFLQLTENKLTKQNIYELGNKDIFYQLKNSNYIKQTSQGVFQGTKLLRNKIEKQIGSQFGKGSSLQHSQKILTVAKCIPIEIIQNRQFKTGTEIDKEFQKYKKSTEFKQRTEKQRQEYESKINNLNQQHFQMQNSSEISLREKLQENITYLKKMENLTRSLVIIEEKRYSIPDFSFLCSKQESFKFLENLSKASIHAGFRCFDKTNIKEETHMNSMKEIIKQSESNIIRFTIEIVTDSYGKEDLERHYLYDQVTQTHTIYV
ncbi:hypothetical protein LBYZC6_22340 [Lacrimispora brassicae]